MGDLEINGVFEKTEKRNKTKSKEDRPWRIKYLGFSFYQVKGKVEIRISDTPFLHQALNNKTLVELGFTSLTSIYC